MKKLITICLIVAATFTAKAQDKEYENRYFYLYVPGTYQDNKTAYISDAIYYTTYNQCGVDYDFVAKARAAFSAYLKVNYNAVFPSGTQNFILVKYKEHSTSTYLKSRQDANVRLNELKDEIIDENYKVNQTNFSYSCD